MKRLLLALVVACSSSSPPSTRGIVHPRQEHGYPLDDVLRMNHVQVKGTHNSYHVETPGNTESTWHYTQKPLAIQADEGVRAFELDTRLSTDGTHFEVFHLPLLDEQTTCRAFADCLAALRGWSDAHPGHEPLMIQIEPKDLPDSDDPEAWFSKLQGEILGAFPRERIVTPDDVQRDAMTLASAVTTRGWPTLGETRGTVSFFVDNQSDFRRLYTRNGTSLEGRLMFVDAAPGDPLAAFQIVNDAANAPAIAAALKANEIVRVFGDTSGDLGHDDAALASGAQIVSTDYPDTLVVPAGTPSRCQPTLAPPGCTPQAIEDPTKLR
jgi:hypothetical protein